MKQSGPKRYQLKVIMPNGQVICHRTATGTYIDTIERIGISRVKVLHLKYGWMPFIDTDRHEVGRQIKSGHYYIKAPSRPVEQAILLVELAEILNINLRVFFDNELYELKEHWGRKLKYM